MRAGYATPGSLKKGGEEEEEKSPFNFHNTRNFPNLLDD
jgi:hypothetical protein